MKATEWKVGMSSCYKRGFTQEMFNEYAEAGIDMMEVSIGNLNHDPCDWAAIRKMADETGIRLWSYHLPFAPFSQVNIAALDAELRRKTVEVLGEYLRYAGSMGIPVAVIHPSGEPNQPGERADRLAYASDCLASLAEIAAREGVTIAVEDLPRTCLGNCSGDILKLLEADSRLGVCFDTNHLLEQDNLDFVREVGDRIITTHVSDYDFLNERHWLPGEGKVDWAALVTALEDCGYTGPWMYEIGSGAPKSITRERNLTCADFRKNYEECTNKQPLTVLGTPVEAECLANAYIK